MSKQYVPQYDLSKFAGGAVQQDFDRAIAEVFANMQDPNTPYKPKRSVTIKVGFEQNEQRDDMNVEIVVDKKLVSKSSINTKMAIAKDLKSGKLSQKNTVSRLRARCLLMIISRMMKRSLRRTKNSRSRKAKEK